MKFLKGCAIGCGVVFLIGAVSCVGFVVWVKQPGEMLEARRLVGSDTTGYAAWTLTLDEPGTRAMVEDLLAGLWRVRDRVDSPLPPVLDSWLKSWQHASDERKLRQLFPLTVAWSMRPGDADRDDLHLLTVSIESLGNRTVLADWILGWALGRAEEVDVVVHDGEKIFGLRDGGAFFLRPSDIVLTTDLDTARLAVERLQEEIVEKHPAGDIESLLATVASDNALLCAISNRRGELQRVVNHLAELDALRPLDSWTWSSVAAVTLAGGFTGESAFRATLTVVGSGGGFEQADADRFAALVTAIMNGESDGIEVHGQAAGETLSVELAIADLPGRVERWLDAHRAAADGAW